MEVDAPSESASLNPHASLLPSYSSAQVTIAAAQKRSETEQRLRRARWIAAAAFGANVGCQVLALLLAPGVKRVADENRFAFSPKAWFLLAFLAGQIVVQAWWVYALFRADEESVAHLEALDYVPVYAVGSVSLGIWTALWATRHLNFALAFITIAAASQLYGISSLELVTYDNLATHVVAKTFAGVGVLAFLDNFAIVLKAKAPPSTLVKALTGVVFGVGSLTTDPIFGACLVYDLLGLVVNQPKPWSSDLAWMTAAVGGVVLVKFSVFKIY